VTSAGFAHVGKKRGQLDRGFAHVAKGGRRGVIATDARRPQAFPPVKYLGRPFPCPFGEGEREPSGPSRDHHQSPAGVRGVRAVMAGPAERDELVEVKIRTALGPLDDVMDL